MAPNLRKPKKRKSGVHLLTVARVDQRKIKTRDALKKPVQIFCFYYPHRVLITVFPRNSNVYRHFFRAGPFHGSLVRLEDREVRMFTKKKARGSSRVESSRVRSVRARRFFVASWDGSRTRTRIEVHHYFSLYYPSLSEL